MPATDDRPYENDDMRAARARGKCGALMANDMRRKSGRHCELPAGHAGRHVSQYAVSRRPIAEKPPVAWECGSCGAITDKAVVSAGELYHLPDEDCRAVRPWHIPGTDYYDGRDGSIERDEEEMTDDEYIEQMDAWRETVEWQRGLLEDR